MSNEIVIQSSVKAENGNFAIGKIGGFNQQIDQAAPGGEVLNITATTVGVDVDMSNLTTEGICRLLNVDETNFVEWGPKSGGTFYPLGKMKPGEPAGPFRLSPGKTLHLKADSASCLVQAVVLED